MGRKPSRRPEAIIDAAIQEFAERGFDGATWRTIAERAGVAQSLLTYHFADKEGLWRAAYRQARERKVAANLPLPDEAEDRDGGDAPPEAPSRDEVEAWLYRYCLSFARRPELALMQVREAQRGSARMRWAADHSLKADYDRLVRAIERLQARGWFEGIAPHALVYALVGAAQYAFLVPGQVEALTGEDTRTDDYAETHARAVTHLFMRFA